MKVSVSDHLVECSTPGLRVAVRRRNGSETGVRPPVLFVHGATYAASLTVDYPLDGVTDSWMASLASAGFDVWCVDLLGYGRSDRPPEMDMPADQHAPLVDTAQAERDVSLVIDFMLGVTGSNQISLIGYSWGTAISGGIAAARPDVVDRLARTVKSR